MPEHCNVCGSLKIHETCYLCGSLNNSTLEDGSGSGARDSSVQDDRLRGFTMVPIPPPAFHTTIPHSPHPNVSPLSPSPGEGGSTPIRRCFSDVLPATSPPRTGIFSYARGELPKPSSSLNLSPPAINPNVFPLSPSAATSGYAELPILSPLRRCISDVLPVASPTTSPVTTQETPDNERLKTIEIALNGYMELMKELKQYYETAVQEAKGAEQHHNNTIRFKRITERINEIEQYCGSLVPAAEGAESHHNNTKTEGSNAVTEEKVSIERVGEALRINMKCACGGAYQFLFSGSNCYYKLM